MGCTALVRDPTVIVGLGDGVVDVDGSSGRCTLGPEVGVGAFDCTVVETPRDGDVFAVAVGATEGVVYGAAVGVGATVGVATVGVGVGVCVAGSLAGGSCGNTGAGAGLGE